MCIRDSPKMLFLKGKSYRREISNLIQKQNFSIEEFQSITDKFGKILYINKRNMLNTKNE